MAAGAGDFVGAIPEGYGWRLQPAREAQSYQAWASAQFNPEGNSETVLPLPSEDSDHDGWSNAAEFALGTAPDDPTSTGAPFGRLIAADAAGNQTLAYTVALDPSAAGARIEPEVSTNLVDWIPVSETEGGLVIDDGWILSVLLDQPVTEETRRFIRLRFEVEEDK